MTEEWEDSFNTIKSLHDEAYRTVEQAIKHEENSQPSLALEKYKEGIKIIDKALSTPVEIPKLADASSIDEQLARVTKMIHKMKCTRGELLLRIGSLYRNADKKENEGSKRKEPDAEEQYTKRPRTYTELADALRILHKNAAGDQMVASNIDLLFACDGVRLYYIENGGEVTTSLQSSTLRIVKIDADHEKNLDETVFLQLIKTCDVGVVAEDNKEEQKDSPTDESFEILETPEEATGDVVPDDSMDPSFIYPLIPGVSPCFRTDYGAFILPDLQSTDGGAIGLILPQEADEIFQDILVAYLKGVISESGAIEFGVDDGFRNKRSTSDAVSSNIVKGATYISRGLIYSAEKAGDLMNYSTPYILSKMQKAPANAPPMSDNVHTGVSAAKTVSGALARGTYFVAGKVGDATVAVGRYLAPHVQKQGTRLLAGTFGMDDFIAAERMSDALKIAAGTAEGVGTVFSGLETSATILGTNLANNGVKAVEHKYGASAGIVASDAFDTVGNIINVKKNFSYLTPKGFVKSAGKNTGKSILREFQPKSYMDKNYVAAGSLYPNLSNFAKELNEQSTSKLMPKSG